LRRGLAKASLQHGVKSRVSKPRAHEGKLAPSPLPIARAAREPRNHLKGFDVFRTDAKKHGEHLKQLCRERGFVGLYPLDSDVPASLPLEGAARSIYRAVGDRSAFALRRRIRNRRLRRECGPDDFLLRSNLLMAVRLNA
jgi:hypothetical protein